MKTKHRRNIMNTTYTRKLENHIKVLQDTLEDLILRIAVLSKTERKKSLHNAQTQLEVSREWTDALLKTKEASE